MSALRSSYSSVWESVRVYTTDVLWEISGVKVRQRERDGRERIWGKAKCGSLCRSLSSRTTLLRVWRSTFFLLPTPGQRRDVLCKGLNFATQGTLGVRLSELRREFVNGGGDSGDAYAASCLRRRGRCFRSKLHCHIQTSAFFPTVQWQEMI